MKEEKEEKEGKEGKARGGVKSVLEESGLVSVRLVVSELDLALKGSKLAGLLLSARVRALDDGLLGLKQNQTYDEFDVLSEGQRERKKKKKKKKKRKEKKRNKRAHLNVKEVQLDGIIAINVLVGEEELLLKHDDLVVVHSLLTKGLVGVEPDG